MTTDSVAITGNYGIYHHHHGISHNTTNPGNTSSKRASGSDFIEGHKSIAAGGSRYLRVLPRYDDDGDDGDVVAEHGCVINKGPGFLKRVGLRLLAGTGVGSAFYRHR